MPLQLDLHTLTELYPSPGERRQFLQRALEILREDRAALQYALAGHACERAAELAHRLQGSVAFLTGEPEQAAAILRPLERAIKQGLPPDSRDIELAALDHLMTLESAMDRATHPD